MRRPWQAAALMALGLSQADRLCAQCAPAGAGAATAEAADTVPPERERAAWSLAASAYAYSVAGSSSYVQPTLTADRGRLHLEARYNYEDFDTASLWIGYNLSSAGEKVTLELTPMIAGVAGDTSGVAPGYRLSIAYRALELSTEGEYVADSRDSSDNFFYSWTELSAWPLDWLGVGLAFQRTRLRQSDAALEPGILVGVAYERASLTVYGFDSGESRPTVVVGVAVGFGHDE